MDTAADLPTVEDSWSRIEAWLARHAPVSHGRLRPPARPEEIAAAERRLGVAFPDDLRASLLRHDGVELAEGTPVLSYCGPLSGVADIVRSTEFLRAVAENGEADDGELGEDELDEYAYWPHHRLLVTLGIGWQSSDGLFLVCRTGPHLGRVGRYFDEDAPSFTPWRSLRHVLADFATALEQGSPFEGRVPLGVEGVLLWDDERSVVADPVSPLALAAATAEPEPPVPGVVVPSGAGFGSGGREPRPVQPDVVFVAGVDPGALLERLGAVPDTVRSRGREQARLSAASPWAASRPMVRAGTCGEWAYAVQEGGDAQFGRPEVLRRLSRGALVVALTKQGPEVRVTVVEDGAVRPEVAELVDSPREDYVVGPAGTYLQRIGADPWPGSTTAYARLLAGLEAEYGISFDPAADGGEPLASALLLPLLDDCAEPYHEVTTVRDFDLGGLIARTEPERLRAAVAAQLVRLAAEAGIDLYPEVAGALERIVRDEPVDLAPDGPLGLRMRTLEAEFRAARQLLDDSRYGEVPPPLTAADAAAWGARTAAARALSGFVRGPLPYAAETVLHERMSVRWREQLAADLAG
ncbi:SMI1/KNR4 family protein [Streptomyces sp. NPDC012888]|uniref:SMI1/KNR4 family protein n=1 Tax=Streptomyces sp. NPDC012888 TaxID=3364855 RepID=UPI0036C1B903